MTAACPPPPPHGLPHGEEATESQGPAPANLLPYRSTFPLEHLVLGTPLPDLVPGPTSLLLLLPGEPWDLLLLSRPPRALRSPPLILTPLPFTGPLLSSLAISLLQASVRAIQRAELLRVLPRTAHPCPRIPLCSLPQPQPLPLEAWLTPESPLPSPEKPPLGQAGAPPQRKAQKLWLLCLIPAHGSPTETLPRRPDVSPQPSRLLSGAPGGPGAGSTQQVHPPHSLGPATKAKSGHTCRF